MTPYNPTDLVDELAKRFPETTISISVEWDVYRNGTRELRWELYLNGPGVKILQKFKDFPALMNYAYTVIKMHEVHQACQAKETLYYSDVIPDHPNQEGETKGKELLP